jgi:DNA modification methylase
MNNIDVDWHHGDCLDIIPKIPDASIDAVITDPPYPEIDRDYGRMTEKDWHEMMRSVVAECRRILKPKGSAVFILQPNSERVGRMRPWLWEFMAWTAREWNMVQDAWWFNTKAMPTVHCQRNIGLMRPSIKAFVWLGAPDCMRYQDDVMIEPAESTKKNWSRNDYRVKISPSSHSVRHSSSIGTCIARGGATPMNLLSGPSGGVWGHGAETPAWICEWWVRYLCPIGGIVCDPFMGIGTVGVASMRNGRSFVGIEKFRKHHDRASQILSAEIVAVSHVDHD